MAQPLIKYDESSDALSISFLPGEKATGIELHENILLRLNRRERRAVGLTIFSYSFLAQRTSLGLRSLPLTGLSELSPELRELVLEILMRAPVKDYLSVSAYTPSLAESIPIASINVDALEPA